MNKDIALVGETVGRPAALEKVRAEGRPEQLTEVRNLAKSLLDEEYFKGLKLRLDSGVCAPAVEAMIWRYAFGDPKADMNERAHEIARFEAIRETVRQRIRAGKTALLDAHAQGASRVLTLAPQPQAQDDDGPE